MNEFYLRVTSEGRSDKIGKLRRKLAIAKIHLSYSNASYTHPYVTDGFLCLFLLSSIYSYIIAFMFDDAEEVYVIDKSVGSRPIP